MSYCFQETVIVISYIFPVNPRQQYLPGKQFSIFILSTAILKSSSCYSTSSFASLPNLKLLSQAVGTSVKTWIKSTPGEILLYHLHQLGYVNHFDISVPQKLSEKQQQQQQQKPQRINFTSTTLNSTSSVSKISQQKTQSSIRVPQDHIFLWWPGKSCYVWMWELDHKKSSAES